MSTDLNNTNLKPDDKNASNGLLTKIWGGPMWTALFSIAFGYPINPTQEHKEHYKNFFNEIPWILPCSYCRTSTSLFYTQFETKFNDSIFESRDALTRWLYRLHETVNAKLGITYEETYEDICTKYESYRAKCVDPKPGIITTGCNMPLDLKAQSFKKASEKTAPCISKKIMSCFVDYARRRGVPFNLEYITNIQKNSEEWTERNRICWVIINEMRINGIPSLEKEGEYKGLPTIHELKLISLRSSNLSRDELHHILDKLGYHIVTVYKLKSEISNFIPETPKPITHPDHTII